MQISPIYNTYSYNCSPTFQRWHRNVLVPKKGLVNRNDTCFFREENFFPRLTKLICEEFKNTPKVNIYCYGCSDGSEPFTVAMRMLTMQDESNPQKFLPIIARDIDPVAIQKAINNDYVITKNEKEYIEYFTHGQYKRFFYQPYEEPDNKNGSQVFVRSELYDNVDFGIGDIFKDLKKINPRNTVLLARNFWPYINDVQRKAFFKDLYNHLDSGSYFVTGEFDHQGIDWQLIDLDYEITKVGFERTPIKYVYKKG